MPTVPYDPKKIYFPSGEIISPFAHAFVEAMLAQADLERAFYELQGVISGDLDLERATGGQRRIGRRSLRS
jgi:hypothetical protein